MNDHPDQKAWEVPSPQEVQTSSRSAQASQPKKRLSERGPDGVFPGLTTLIHDEEANPPRLSWECNQYEAVMGINTLHIPPNLLWQAHLAMVELNRSKEAPSVVEFILAKYDTYRPLFDLLMELDHPGSLPDPATPETREALKVARQLYLQGPYWQKVELESRLLTNQTSERIATAMQLTCLAVDFYQLLFFRVRRCLKYTSTINVYVLGIHDEATNQSIGGWVRKQAYDGGIYVLEAVLKVIELIRYPHLIEARPSKSDQDYRKELQIHQSLILSLILYLVPVTDKNRFQWLRLNILFEKLEWLEQLNGTTGCANAIIPLFEPDSEEPVDHLPNCASADGVRTPGV